MRILFWFNKCLLMGFVQGTVPGTIRRQGDTNMVLSLEGLTVLAKNNHLGVWNSELSANGAKQERTCGSPSSTKMLQITSKVTASQKGKTKRMVKVCILISKRKSNDSWPFRSLSNVLPLQSSCKDEQNERTTVVYLSAVRVKTSNWWPQGYSPRQE